MTDRPSRHIELGFCHRSRKQRTLHNGNRCRRKRLIFFRNERLQRRIASRSGFFGLARRLRLRLKFSNALLSARQSEKRNERARLPRFLDSGRRVYRDDLRIVPDFRPPGMTSVHFLRTHRIENGTRSFPILSFPRFADGFRFFGKSVRVDRKRELRGLRKGSKIERALVFGNGHDARGDNRRRYRISVVRFGLVRFEYRNRTHIFESALRFPFRLRFFENIVGFFVLHSGFGV